MSGTLIKQWSKIGFWLVMAISVLIDLISATIFWFVAKSWQIALIDGIVLLLINLVVLLLIYGFSSSATTYQNVYQIKIGNQQKKISFFQFLLIVLAISWLVFFVGNAFYMFGDAINSATKPNYFATLNKQWSKLIAITLEQSILIIIHRQMINFAIQHQRLPWQKSMNT